MTKVLITPMLGEIDSDHEVDDIARIRYLADCFHPRIGDHVQLPGKAPDENFARIIGIRPGSYLVEFHGELLYLKPHQNLERDGFDHISSKTTYRDTPHEWITIRTKSKKLFYIVIKLDTAFNEQAVEVFDRNFDLIPGQEMIGFAYRLALTRTKGFVDEIESIVNAFNESLWQYVCLVRPVDQIILD